LHENSLIQTSKRENCSVPKNNFSNCKNEIDTSKSNIKNDNKINFENKENNDIFFFNANNNSNENKKVFIQINETNNDNTNDSRNKSIKVHFNSQISFGNLFQNNSSIIDNNNIKGDLPIENNINEKEDNKVHKTKLEKEIKTKLSIEKFMMKLNESKEFNKKKSLNESSESNSFIEKIKKENDLKRKEEEEEKRKKLKEDLMTNKTIEIYNKEKDNNLINQENQEEEFFEQKINEENIKRKEEVQNSLSKDKMKQKLNEKFAKRLESYKINKINNNNDNKNILEGIESIESKINTQKFRPIEKSYTISDKAKIIQNLMLGKNLNNESNQIIIEKKENFDINNLINQKPVIKKKKKTYKPFLLPNN
jgi:hypothetical protein